jgi:hypothetical protein
MTQEDKNKMDEIKEYLTIQFQGSSDFVKERIKILLRDEVVTYHKCCKCGNKFETNDEENFKRGITIFP